MQDHELRLARIRRLLATLGLSRSVALLSALLRRADGEALDLMFLLALELSSEDAEVSRRALVRTALRDDEPMVAFVFDTNDVAESHESKPGKLAYNLDRPITLGERKTLARTNDRRLLDRVLRDPNASVIESVLENPHLTESDVLAIAASKRSAEVLAPVTQSGRWVVRYDVRIALTFNPMFPLERALPLTASLRSAELREIRAGGPFRDKQKELAEGLLIYRNGSA